MAYLPPCVILSGMEGGFISVQVVHVHRVLYSADFFNFVRFFTLSPPKMPAPTSSQNMPKDVVMHKSVPFGGPKTII